MVEQKLLIPNPNLSLFCTLLVTDSDILEFPLPFIDEASDSN